MYFNSELQFRRRAIPTYLLVAVASACAIGLPFITIPLVAAALAAICSAFLVISSEKKPLTVIALVGFVSMFFTKESIAVVAITLSLVVGAGALAKAVDKLRSNLLWAIPIAAFAIGAVVTRDLLISSLALSILLPAVALCITFRKKHARVGAICLVSGAYMIFFAAFVLADIYVATGSVSLSIFGEITEEYKKSFTEILLQFKVMDVATETSVPYFTELEAKNLATEIVSLFPAFFVILCNAAAYFSQKLMYALARREGEENKFDDKMIAMILSPYAGATFLISFFVMMMAASSVDHAVAYTVSANVFYIFIPGLALSGLMFQLAKVARFRRGIWLVILLVILVFVNVGMAILLAACLGAYYSIASPVYAYLNSKKHNDPFE